MKIDHFPKPVEIMERSQLAIVVALDATMIAAVRALDAAHPEIHEGTFPRNTTESDYWAERLIDLGLQLQLALEKYQASLKEENNRPVDF